MNATRVSASTTLALYNNSLNRSIWIDNVLLRRPGVLIDANFAINAGLVIIDRARGKTGFASAAGISYLAPSRSGTLVWEASASGYFFADKQVLPSNHRLRSIVAQITSGTATQIDIGSSNSTTEDIVQNAGSFSNGTKNDLTLITRFSSTSKLYFTLAGTATVKFTVDFDLVG